MNKGTSGSYPSLCSVLHQIHKEYPQQEQGTASNPDTHGLLSFFLHCKEKNKNGHVKPETLFTPAQYSLLLEQIRAYEFFLEDFRSLDREFTAALQQKHGAAVKSIQKEGKEAEQPEFSRSGAPKPEPPHHTEGKKAAEEAESARELGPQGGDREAGGPAEAARESDGSNSVPLKAEGEQGGQAADRVGDGMQVDHENGCAVDADMGNGEEGSLSAVPVLDPLSPEADEFILQNRAHTLVSRPQYAYRPALKTRMQKGGVIQAHLQPQQTANWWSQNLQTKADLKQLSRCYMAMNAAAAKAFNSTHAGPQKGTRSPSRAASLSPHFGPAAALSQFLPPAAFMPPIGPPLFQPAPSGSPSRAGPPVLPPAPSGSLSPAGGAPLVPSAPSGSPPRTGPGAPLIPATSPTRSPPIFSVLVPPPFPLSALPPPAVPPPSIMPPESTTPSQPPRSPDSPSSSSPHRQSNPPPLSLADRLEKLKLLQRQVRYRVTACNLAHKGAEYPCRQMPRLLNFQPKEVRRAKIIRLETEDAKEEIRKRDARRFHVRSYRKVLCERAKDVQRGMREATDFRQKANRRLLIVVKRELSKRAELKSQEAAQRDPTEVAAEERQRSVREQLRKYREAQDEVSYRRLVEECRMTKLQELFKKTDEVLESLESSLKQAAADTGGEGAAGAGKGAVFAAGDAGVAPGAAWVEKREKVEPPSNLNGELRKYQMAGLEFLVNLYNKNRDGILADAMGLGKTIQTVALFAYLAEVKRNFGPHLILAPLSTLHTGWERELKRWYPDCVFFLYEGAPEVRKTLRAKYFQYRGGKPVFNVLVTTDKYAMKDKAYLSKFEWEYLVVDEAHRLKNPKSKLVQVLNRNYKSRRRLALTGTPLQNDLQEVWALLNFLMPKVFNSSATFRDWFDADFVVNRGGSSSSSSSSSSSAAEEEQFLDEERKMLIIRRLHKILERFLLRREKKEVEDEVPKKTEQLIACPMSGVQRCLYEMVSGKDGFGCNNPQMQQRKVVNHPYLMLGREKCPIDESLIRVSGKLETLDRILLKMKRTRHRCLIFSQMAKVLDLLEVYLSMRNFSFLRLDGSTPSDERRRRLNDFQTQNIFCFILSTKAGGLGVNLQAADTVIIFDSDWNPQNDEQAQSRAHRIGQTREVLTLRLFCPGTVEEKMLETAGRKLDQDAFFIRGGQFDGERRSQNETREHLEKLLKEKAGVNVQNSAERFSQISDLDVQHNRKLARNAQEEMDFYVVDVYRREKGFPGLITEEILPPSFGEYIKKRRKTFDSKELEEMRTRWNEALDKDDVFAFERRSDPSEHLTEEEFRIKEQLRILLNRQVLQVVEDLQKKTKYADFWHMPDFDSLPGYRDKIQNPCSLDHLKKFSEEGKFRCFRMVEKYTSRIAGNARDYNGIQEGDTIFYAACKLAGEVTCMVRQNGGHFANRLQKKLAALALPGGSVASPVNGSDTLEWDGRNEVGQGALCASGEGGGEGDSGSKRARVDGGEEGLPETDPRGRGFAAGMNVNGSFHPHAAAAAAAGAAVVGFSESQSPSPSPSATASPPRGAGEGASSSNLRFPPESPVGGRADGERGVGDAVEEMSDDGDGMMRVEELGEGEDEDDQEDERDNLRSEELDEDIRAAEQQQEEEEYREGEEDEGEQDEEEEEGDEGGEDNGGDEDMDDDGGVGGEGSARLPSKLRKHFQRGELDFGSSTLSPSPTNSDDFDDGGPQMRLHMMQQTRGGGRPHLSSSSSSSAAAAPRSPERPPGGGPGLFFSPESTRPDPNRSLRGAGGGGHPVLRPFEGGDAPWGSPPPSAAAPGSRRPPGTPRMPSPPGLVRKGSVSSVTSVKGILKQTPQKGRESVAAGSEGGATTRKSVRFHGETQHVEFRKGRRTSELLEQTSPYSLALKEDGGRGEHDAIDADEEGERPRPRGRFVREGGGESGSDSDSESSDEDEDEAIDYDMDHPGDGEEDEEEDDGVDEGGEVYVDGEDEDEEDEEDHEEGEEGGLDGGDYSGEEGEGDGFVEGEWDRDGDGEEEGDVDMGEEGFPQGEGGDQEDEDEDEEDGDGMDDVDQPDEDEGEEGDEDEGEGDGFEEEGEGDEEMDGGYPEDGYG